MNVVRFYEYLTGQLLIPAKMTDGAYLLDLRYNLYKDGTLIATQVSYFTDEVFVKNKGVFSISSPQKLLYTLQRTPVFYTTFEKQPCVILRDGSFVQLHTGRELVSMSYTPRSYFSKARHPILTAVNHDIATAVEYGKEFSYKPSDTFAALQSVRSYDEVLEAVALLLRQGFLWNAKLLLFSLCYSVKDEIFGVLDRYFCRNIQSESANKVILDTLLFLIEFNGYVHFYGNN